MKTRRHVRISVHDLDGGHAGATTVERELHRVLGAYVNPATATARIDHDPAATDPWSLAWAIERTGYRPKRPVEA